MLLLPSVEHTSTTTTFLSTTSDWNSTNCSFNINWNNKNRECIKDNKQKIIRFIHSKSNTPTSAKNGAIYSQLLRMSRNTNKEFMITNLLELFKEYTLLDYNPSMINKQIVIPPKYEIHHSFLI